MVEPKYRQIQDWVKAEYGFTPKTCWIAHCKELTLNMKILKSTVVQILHYSVTATV